MIRDQALVALRSGPTRPPRSSEARAEVPPLVRDAVEHAIVVAALGGIAGSALVGCVLAVDRRPAAARAGRAAGSGSWSRHA